MSCLTDCRDRKPDLLAPSMAASAAPRPRPLLSWNDWESRRSFIGFQVNLFTKFEQDLSDARCMTLSPQEHRERRARAGSICAICVPAIAVEGSLGYLPPEIKREILIRLPLALIDERLDRACDRYKVAVDMEYDYVVGRGARSGAPRLRRRPAKPASCHSDL